MSAPELPEWMKQRLERASQRNIQAQLRHAQERSAELLIEKDGPEFWKAFLHFLRFNVDALPKIGMSGRVVEVSAPEEGPQIYQVHVRGGEPFFQNTYSTIQIDLSRERAIHCVSVKGETTSIRLAASPSLEAVGAIWLERVMPLNAQQTADEVFQEIVNRINPE